MHQALVLGCSHAAGSEMALGNQDFLATLTLDQRAQHERDCRSEFERKMFNTEQEALTASISKQQVQYERDHSFAAIIAKQLGYKVNNQAIPGGSNDAMFRIFQTKLVDLNANDIVIACWTGGNRTEVQNYQDQAWLPFAPGSAIVNNIQYQNFLKQWTVLNTGNTWAQLNKIKNIVALNALAQQYNIRVINLNTFWQLDNVAGYWPVPEYFCEWCLKRDYSHTDWGHFYQPAHVAYAEFVLEHINAWPQG